MKNFIFKPLDTSEAYVTAFLQPTSNDISKEPRPSIVICPGGGYSMVSDREAEPVAKKYYAAGYNAFILFYSVLEHAKNFQPLLELAASIAYIRKNAEVWNINPNRIAVCGFSAGGHLAASLGTLFNEEKFLQVCPELGNIRPNAMILGYPVITADKYAHVGSIRTVSDGEEGSEAYYWFGLDKHVDEHTPQTFLWHTASDQSVPVENSLAFAAALSAAKVPFELHILPSGKHGMSTCSHEVGSYYPYNARWVEWSIAWLNKMFDYEN